MLHVLEIALSSYYVTFLPAENDGIDIRTNNLGLMFLYIDRRQWYSCKLLGNITKKFTANIAFQSFVSITKLKAIPR